MHVALAWEGGLCFTPYSEQETELVETTIIHWPVVTACPAFKRSRSSILPFSIFTLTPSYSLRIQSITTHSINQSSNQCYSTLTSIIILTWLLEIPRYNFTCRIKEDQGTQPTPRLPQPFAVVAHSWPCHMSPPIGCYYTMLMFCTG